VRPSQNAATACEEYKSLVRKHLKAISEWKRTFDNGEVWEKIVEMERGIAEHCEKHCCQDASQDRSEPISSFEVSPITTKTNLF
jgi:hypothetical protein